MAKIITVFGATGLQGGAVARALTKDPQFKIRAVTRNIQSEKVQQLVSDGIDVLFCDFKDVDSVRCVLNGSYGCFVVTYTDFEDSDCMDNELQIGKNIADACEQAGVEHVILSTQLHSLNIIGVAARHLVAKAEIEQYMRDKRQTMSCIMVPCYYEDFFEYLKPEKVDQNNYNLVIPMGMTPLDMVSVENIGEVVRVMLTSKSAYTGKTVSVSGDKLTVKEMAAILSRHLSPKCFKDKQVTMHEYGQLAVPWARDFANMFDFFVRVDQRYNIHATKNINPSMHRFEEWVKANVNRLHRALA